MSRNTEPIERLSWEWASRVDALCDRFEEGWRAGRRPRIEEYLEGLGELERLVLLSELLALEIEYRRRGGEEPALEEYRARFPRDAEIVAEMLGMADAAGDAAPGLAARGAAGGNEPAAANGEPGPAARPDSSPRAVDPGAPLPFSDFELRRKLGETSMSTVWEAEQKSLGKRVAVKVLRRVRNERPEAVERFLREARAVAQLRHPDIVDVHGLGRTGDGGYFLVMDFIDGIDLETRIARERVPPEEAARIVATVARAVQHAHDRGVIHRDLKPSNVLLQDGECPLLADFGLAKLLHGDLPALSGPDDILGTPSYMSPEQADPRRGAVGPRTDVFGLGGILYALLAREPPFPGRTVSEVLEKVKSPLAPVAPGRLASGVPPELEAIAMTCLEKDPRGRYASAREVEGLLREWLARTRSTGARGGGGGSIGDLARRLEAATGDAAFELIGLLGRTRSEEAVRPLLLCLQGRPLAVRKAAGKAILDIGWQTAAAVIEGMARRGDEEGLAAALEGLAAFEAHPDTVGLLERLVPALRGSLRNRAVLLLERKRLALTSDRARRIFERSAYRYRIEKALGQGAFTACYRAHDVQFDLPVVVRVLRPEFARQPEMVASFLDLGRQAYAHVHQNLLAVRDVGSVPEEELHYIVRDYVDGVTLQQLLQSERSLLPVQIVELLHSAASALEPLHRGGVAHGGVKPSNLFLRRDDHLFLGDRSLPLHRSNVALERLTYDFLYVSPELATGDPSAGPAADFYSLGCVAYELATLTPPYGGESPMEIVIRHARDPLPDLAPVREKLGARGEACLRRLLAKRPAERFRDLGELLEELLALRADLRGAVCAREVDPFVERTAAEPPVATSELFDRLQGTFLFLEAPGAAEAAPEAAVAGLRHNDLHDGVARCAEAAPEAAVAGPASGESAGRAEARTPVAGGPAAVRFDARRVRPPSVNVSNDLAVPASEEIRRRGYRIIRVLGTGGMGVVLEAEQVALERRVALKIIRSPRESSGSQAAAQLTERFRRESLVMAKLPHSHIVPIYDLFEDGDHLVIAMEFVAGGSLADRLREVPEHRLALCEALAVARDVAEALALAHKFDIVHRDVKPGNILLDEEGRALLGDFGLAGFAPQAPGEAPEEDKGVTQVLQRLGTPLYMAPEQYASGRVSPKADVFALGVTLYHALSGQVPYSGESPYDVLSQAVEARPVALRKAAPGVPRALEKLVAQMMDPRPEKRPTAKTVEGELEALLWKHCRGAREAQQQVRAVPGRRRVRDPEAPREPG